MKKRILIALVVVLALAATASVVWADKPIGFDAQGNETAWASSNPNCTKIQDGTLHATTGELLTTGYDEFGYNYQAHMFNGTYDGADRNLDGTYWGDTGDYVDDKLMMKWSDAWLANVDCDDDGELDRGLVNGEVGGTSLGWLTNHVEGDYVDANGVQHYVWFGKIVWTGPGSPLWGQYTVIEEVLNDPAAGFAGLYDKIGAPGFGLNDHWTESAP